VYVVAGVHTVKVGQQQAHCENSAECYEFVSGSELPYPEKILILLVDSKSEIILPEEGKLIEFR